MRSKGFFSKSAIVFISFFVCIFLSGNAFGASLEDIKRWEKERNVEALGRIGEYIGRIKALKEKIRAILDQIPEGVRGSFPVEVQKVKDWLSASLPEYSQDMDSATLKQVVERLEGVIGEGEEALRLIIDVKERKREKKARELMCVLERLRAELSGVEGLLNKWRPGVYGELSGILDRLSPMIEMGEFVSVERELKELAGRLKHLKEEVTTLEAQDNQRRYVLDALRKVCCDEMGWSEEKEPELEGGPETPIIYEVNTYYAGVITFRLTLDEIKVDSPISREKNLCYREFDSISEKLKNFGVITRFRGVDTPDEDPKLIQKGEIDLPDEGMVREEEV